MSKGIVYILTNQAYPDYIKIGKTTNLEQRLKSLDTTGVPLPFECYYAIEVSDYSRVEKLIHQSFDKYRELIENFNYLKIKSALKLKTGKILHLLMI